MNIKHRTSTEQNILSLGEELQFTSHNHIISNYIVEVD